MLCLTRTLNIDRIKKKCRKYGRKNIIYNCKQDENDYCMNLKMNFPQNYTNLYKKIPNNKQCS